MATQSRPPKIFLFLTVMVLTVVMRQVLRAMGRVDEPLVWSLFFGVTMGIVMVLCEMALGAWHRRRTDAS